MNSSGTYDGTASLMLALVEPAVVTLFFTTTR
jgi:hypothetical protein